MGNAGWNGLSQSSTLSMRWYMTRQLQARPTLLIVLVLASLGSISGLVSAQKASEQRRVRARPPKFSEQEASRVFFDDVFSHLVGARPKNASADSVTPMAKSDGATEPAGTDDVRPGQFSAGLTLSVPRRLKTKSRL